MKKIISLILTVLMLFGANVAVFAEEEASETSTEVVISSWAEEEVEKAIELGFVPIALRGDYTKDITRGQFANMALCFLAMQYGYQSEHILRTYYNLTEDFDLRDFISAYCSVKKDRNGNDFENNGEKWTYENKNSLSLKFTDTQFTDLDELVDCRRDMIGYAYNFGIVNGISDTEFNPNGGITRQEAAAMLIRVYESYADYENADSDYVFNDDSEISDWAKENVYKAVNLGAMQGVGNDTFSPLSGYTVEQAAASFLRLYESAPTSRKNKNIEPLLDYEYEKENFIIPFSGYTSFTKEAEYDYDKYVVMTGTESRRRVGDDHKIMVFYKYGGARGLTSFTPIAQANEEPIEEITLDEGNNTISFIANVADTFIMYNGLYSADTVYKTGEYRFEIDLVTGNIISLAYVG